MGRPSHRIVQQQQSSMTPLSLVTPMNAAFLVAVLVSGSVGGAFGAETITLHLKNKCPFTVWATWTPLCTDIKCLNKCPTASELGHGQRYTIYPPHGWRGKLWARTGCHSSVRDLNRLTCLTADCAGKFSCDGLTAALPYTLASFHPVSSELQEYGVSTLRGFNVPMTIAPDSHPASRLCHSVGCDCDVLPMCPKDLRRESTDEVVGCYNPCSQGMGHWHSECCDNVTASVARCPFGQIMDGYCSMTDNLPSFANHTQTCDAPAYTVTFCPSGFVNAGKDKMLAIAAA